MDGSIWEIIALLAFAKLIGTPIFFALRRYQTSTATDIHPALMRSLVIFALGGVGFWLFYEGATGANPLLLNLEGFALDLQTLGLSVVFSAVLIGTFSDMIAARESGM